MIRSLLPLFALPLLGLAGAAPAHGPEAHETTTRKFETLLPNVPGKTLLAVEVEYPAGASTPSHTHEKSAFIFAYVLEGEVESALDHEPPRLYRAGDSWTELPGAHHRVSRNASKTRPAKLLAVFVADEGVARLTFPEARGGAL